MVPKRPASYQQSWRLIYITRKSIKELLPDYTVNDSSSGGFLVVLAAFLRANATGLLSTKTSRLKAN
jgi:hypothetical protein